MFIMPLIRMVISIIGDWKSQRREQAFELIQTFIRSTLRRITRAPRNASSEIYNYLCGWDKQRLIDLIQEMDETGQRKTQVRFIDDELMFQPSREWLEEIGTVSTSKIKAVHQEIDEILRTLNNFRCKQHPDKTLSFQHLEQHPEVRLQRPEQLFSHGK